VKILEFQHRPLSGRDLHAMAESFQRQVDAILARNGIETHTYVRKVRVPTVAVSLNDGVWYLHQNIGHDSDLEELVFQAMQAVDRGPLSNRLPSRRQA
jgi:hypothetical protein